MFPLIQLSQVTNTYSGAANHNPRAISFTNAVYEKLSELPLPGWGRVDTSLNAGAR